VNAAAPTKNTSKATKTQDMPLRRRFFFGVFGKAAGKSSLAEYCPTPYPAMLCGSRNPQFRQKRRSDGILEWQFEQVISVACDI
jgi:hypothetical protein